MYGNSLLLDRNEKEVPEWRNRIKASFEQMMHWLWRRKRFNPEMLEAPEVRQFIDTTAGILNTAIDEGIKQVPVGDIMKDRLRNSNFVFSGFKAFHELNEAFLSLLDENGNRKPFETFLRDIQAIDENYNKWYLKAEYDFAVASAQMAAKWDKFAAGSDKYDLQYRTVGDNRVRETHRKLNGITLPVTSRFWDSYFPPNGWGCRCDVIQVLKGKYPGSNEQQALKEGELATSGKHQEMFRFNPGKQHATFPAYNPYTIKKCSGCANNGFKLAKIPDNEMCKACRIIQEMDKEYYTVETNNGMIRVNIHHGKSELKMNIKVARYFAEKYGYEIDLLPRSYTKSTPDVYNRTLRVEQEYKLNKEATYNAIDAALRKAKKQADHIVLWIESGIDEKVLYHAIESRVRRSENIQSVTVVHNGKDYTYTRKDLTPKNRTDEE